MTARIRDLLLPGVAGAEDKASELGWRGELDLRVDTDGGMSLEVFERGTRTYRPLLARSEIDDESYRDHFGPRVMAVVKELTGSRPKNEVT